MNTKKTVDIYSIAFGGEGIGKIDGKICFVTGALVGEKVVVKIVKESKSFTKAILHDIIIPSPDRQECICPLAYNYKNNCIYCPGCTYQHVSYLREIELKNQQFSDLLKRFAGISDEIKLSPIYSEKYLNYRNKIIMHKIEAQSRIGFVSSDNVNVLSVPECHLACKEINKALKDIYLGTISTSIKQLKRVLFRYSHENGLLILSGNIRKKTHTYITETSEFGQFFVSPYSFFQINIFARNLLLSEFINILNGLEEGIIIDLYCGAGIFGILAAERGFKSYCADIDQAAILMAKRNAEVRTLKNIDFLTGDAAFTFEQILGRKSTQKICLVVDPPRTGLDASLIKLINDRKPKSLIYISCAADTLCRDLRILVTFGYEVKSTKAIDMFPRTKHFETITLLSTI